MFRLEPHQLVAGTDYPSSKAERLPVVVARYTEVEHQLAVLGAELEILACAGRAPARTARELAERWQPLLRGLLAAADDADERRLLREALGRLADGTT